VATKLRKARVADITDDSEVLRLWRPIELPYGYSCMRLIPTPQEPAIQLANKRSREQRANTSEGALLGRRPRRRRLRRSAPARVTIKKTKSRLPSQSSRFIGLTREASCTTQGLWSASASQPPLRSDSIACSFFQCCGSKLRPERVYAAPASEWSPRTAGKHRAGTACFSRENSGLKSKTQFVAPAKLPIA